MSTTARTILLSQTKMAAKKAVCKLEARLSAGERRNTKRMAQVQAIYTVGRYVRAPEDVLADLSGARSERSRPLRPKVTNMRVWASVEHEPEIVVEEAFRGLEPAIQSISTSKSGRRVRAARCRGAMPGSSPSRR